MRQWFVVFVVAAAGCSERPPSARPSVNLPAREPSTPAADPVATAAAPALPTPAPAPRGSVSEVRTIAGMAPAQVWATLLGSKAGPSASENDCGSGPEALLQCVDLVVSRLPKVARVPRVDVFAKRPTEPQFLGPCDVSADGADCARVLGMPPAAIRMIGRHKLEVRPDGFQVRWRAVNLAPTELDVKLVVYF